MKDRGRVCLMLLGLSLFILAGYPAFAEDPSAPAIDAESKVGILKEMRVAPATLKVGTTSFVWNLNRTQFFDLKGNSQNWERFREHFKGRGVMVFYDGKGMVVEVRAVLF